MRWIRYSFTFIAIALLILWLVSYYVCIYSSGPCAGSNSPMEVCVSWGRCSLIMVDRIHPQYAPQNWSTDFVIQKNDKLMLVTWPENYIGPPMKGESQFVLSIGNWGSSVYRYGTNFYLRFPLWLPTLLFALWPAIASARHIKRRRLTENICTKCGYDLRATPSGICPECGHEQAVTKTA